MSQNSVTINIPSNATLTINANGQAAWTGTSNIQAASQSDACNNIAGTVTVGTTLSGDITGTYGSGGCSIAAGYYNGNILTDPTYGTASGSLVVGGGTLVGTYGTSTPNVYGGYTATYPYTQPIGVTAGWTGDISLTGNWINTQQYWPLVESTVDEAIKTNNIEALTQMGNQAIAQDRRLFNKVAKAVFKSNNWLHMANFITRTSNIDMKHYTKKMLQAFRESTEETKETTLSSFVSSFMTRFDTKEYVRFAIAHKSHELLTSIVTNLISNNTNFVNNTYNYGNYVTLGTNGVMPMIPVVHSEKTFRKTYGARYSDFEKVMLLSENENILYYLFTSPMEMSKINIFRRVRQLGKIEMAEKIVEESKEKWAEALRNMK